VCVCLCVERRVELTDLENKNTGYPVTFEFQINNKYMNALSNYLLPEFKCT
jgi:hypothetical protein